MWTMRASPPGPRSVRLGAVTLLARAGRPGRRPALPSARCARPSRARSRDRPCPDVGELVVLEDRLALDGREVAAGEHGAGTDVPRGSGADAVGLPEQFGQKWIGEARFFFFY